MKVFSNINLVEHQIVIIEGFFNSNGEIIHDVKASSAILAHVEFFPNIVNFLSPFDDEFISILANLINSDTEISRFLIVKSVWHRSIVDLKLGKVSATR